MTYDINYVVDNNSCNIVGLIECNKYMQNTVVKIESFLGKSKEFKEDDTKKEIKNLQNNVAWLPKDSIEGVENFNSLCQFVKFDLDENNVSNLKDKIENFNIPYGKSSIFILPKNHSSFLNGNDKKKLFEFKLEFEKFVHTYMASSKKDHSPIAIKNPNEDGGFDETILHSSKFEAWHRLDKTLKKSIKNKPSKIHKYTDVFNSKSIEKTIFRGTFLLSSNNSPIFNQGLLNPDEAYRVHAKDELYKFGAFILDLYGTKLSIAQDNIQNIFRSLSKEFQNQYGLNLKIDFYERNNQNKLISILENIIIKNQPITEDIKELENTIKNMIFGKDSIVAIDNFQHAWEELIAGALENIYTEAKVFREDEIGLYSDNGSSRNDGLYPDIVMLKDNIIHIFDPKYKEVESETKQDWIKQYLYVNHFLVPKFNQINNNLKVNTSLIHIYPIDQENKITIANSNEFNSLKNGITSIGKKIILNFFELLKAYNKVEVSVNLSILFEDNHLEYPNNKNNSLFIPSCCYKDNGSMYGTEKDCSINKYCKYFYDFLINKDYDNTNQDNENSSKNSTYFKTKKLALNPGTSKYDFFS